MVDEVSEIEKNITAESGLAEKDCGEIKRFVASDGYRFCYRHFPAETGEPRGYVVALHGVQSHSGWYGFSSRAMSRAGFDVRFLDRRGSGLNGEDRGHAIHADRLVNDVAQFLAEVRAIRNSVGPLQPVILLGLSWGGKLATAVAAQRPELVDGLVLLYPGLCSQIRPTFRQRFLLRLAKSFDVMRKVSPIPLQDPALFTGEAEWQQFIRDDKLALHEATSGFFLANGALDRAVQRHPEWIHCPALLMLAGKDRIIDNDAVKRMYERFGSSQRAFAEYSTAGHTLEFEPNRAEIFAELVAWLGAQVKKD